MSNSPPMPLSESKMDMEKQQVDAFLEQSEAEADHQIKFRTLSWQRTACLLFAEYISLSVLALPWSWSVLGVVGGTLLTIGLGLVTLYTSYVLWQFYMVHPEVRDICDMATHIFPGAPRIAYELTAIGLLLNNIFLIGFHVFTGAQILNTLSDSSVCTAIFQFIVFIMGVVFSLPRTLKHVSLLSIISAVSMGIAILTFLVYVGTEDHPGFGYQGDWPSVGPVTVAAGAPAGGTTFVAGTNAALNITFIFIGQVLYYSFCAEMKRPQDFPKALGALAIMELILFCVVAGVGYHYLGQYATAPGVGSLLEGWARKSSFAFVLPPTLIIGAIYSNVASQYLFRRTLAGTKHLHSHTFKGWATWIGITALIWGIGFILANVIPSMGDFLAIMSSLFDSFFGFLFWAVAYWHLNRGKLFSSFKMVCLTLLNIVIFGLGLFMLGPGLYTSISAIINDYKGSTRSPFSCASTTL